MVLRKFVKAYKISDGPISSFLVDSYEITYNNRGDEFVRVRDLRGLSAGCVTMWFMDINDINLWG